MKRILGHVVAMVAVGLGVAAVVPACATNDQSIFVRGVLAPSSNRQNGFCSYTNDPQQTILFAGTLDVGVSSGYRAVMLAGNQLTPRADQLQTRAETSRTHINGVVVRVTDLNGNELGNFTSYATGMSDPSATLDPGYGVFAATILDGPTSARIAEGITNRTTTRQVLSFVKAFGKTTGGEDVESDEFQFPIYVCKGCLVSFATGTDPAQPLPNCAAPLDTGGGQVAPCLVGQDEAVPCQLCQGNPICDPSNP